MLHMNYKKKIKIKNLLISSIIGMVWFSWLIFSFNLRPIWIIGETYILGQFDYIYFISFFFIYLFLYSPEYCQNSLRSILYSIKVGVIVYLNVLFLFTIKLTNEIIQTDYYEWLSFISINRWLTSLDIIFLLTNGIIIGILVYQNIIKWRKFHEMVKNFSNTSLFNKKRFLYGGIIFLISSLGFTLIYLNFLSSSYLFSNYYLIFGIVFLLQSILYGGFISRHRAWINRFLDMFIIGLVDILGISFFYAFYLDLFKSYSQNWLEIIGFLILLLTYLISIVRFMGRTYLSDKFEEFLEKSDKETSKNTNKMNETESSVTYSTKNKSEKKKMNEIYCQRCQNSFNFPENILNVINKRTSIYCPHCGFRLWWYELNKDINQGIISEHQQVINELRKKTDEEISLINDSPVLESEK